MHHCCSNLLHLAREPEGCVHGWDAVGMPAINMATQRVGCMIAGSVSFPFAENLMNVPQMVELCKERASQVHQPDEQMPKLDVSGLESSNSKPSAVEHAARHVTVASEQTIAASPSSGDESAVQHSSGDGLDKAELCNNDVIIVCRRGNDSQQIVQSLRNFGVASAVDLVGGLSAWSRLDTSFPDY